MDSSAEAPRCGDLHKAGMTLEVEGPVQVAKTLRGTIPPKAEGARAA